MRYSATVRPPGSSTRRQIGVSVIRSLFLARGSSCHFECVLGGIVVFDFYDFLAKVLPEKTHVRSSAKTSLSVSRSRRLKAPTTSEFRRWRIFLTYLTCQIRHYIFDTVHNVFRSWDH